MAMQNKIPPAGTDKNPGSLNENETAGAVNNGDEGSNDVTPEELELLDNAGIRESSGDDDVLLANSQLDDTDEDNEKLNEENDLTGDDLDVPGSESDDEYEAFGEEDEENNNYSISDQDDNSES